jgi:hypothetical protein
MSDANVTIAGSALKQLLRAAALSVPAERYELLASRFTTLVDAANEVSRMVASRRELTQITQFVNPDPGAGEA